MNSCRFLMLPLFLVLGGLSESGSGSDYLQHVKPLLEQKCYACHGAFKQQGSLRVDTAESLLRGGDSGAAVTPKHPEESLLIGVLTGDAGFRMPPENDGAPLTAEEIELVRDWIKAGAPLPEKEEPQADPRTWWSYVPIERPPLPGVQEPGWCRNELDFFITAARESHELRHAPEAPKEVWLRRVFLDLIGLPPSREELQRFQADTSPDAYDKVVDDLLDSPHYGERWGRHWMDVWRYSDWYGSRGINEIRYSQRHIWRWRDWIINSLNADKGYDQMVREMLAADELAGDDPSVLPATGYLGRNWYKFDRDVWLFETVERTGEAFLGLTFRCARCHDHKFDPITQEEYYRFRAFFEPHDVRTDPVSALTPTEKDATLGQVPTDGIPLVYDKTVDASTYLFERGDSRYPDKSRPLSPGVPAAMGGELNIQPVELPVEAWYPILRPAVRDTLLEQAANEVAGAAARLEEKRQIALVAGEKLANAEQQDSATNSTILLSDDFSEERSDQWQILSGNWAYHNGKLTQTAVTSFATAVTKTPITGDFEVRLKYRTLEPGTYRSVGFSFDYLDQGNSQDVYTSTSDARQSVQAFHRHGGKQSYPQAGIVATPLRVGQEIELRVTVLGSKLTIELNGEHKLDYQLPIERRDGKFALWVHQGAVEFDELTITQLAESRETLAQRVKDAERAVELAKAEWELSQAKERSVEKRLTAEIQKYSEQDGSIVDPVLEEAVKAEQEVAMIQAKLDILKAGTNEEEFKKATQSLADAEAALNMPVETYSPLGEQYPRTSTGRRSALAEWITSRDNPRAARVAVNQIWLRHFGKPLVATPENFGLNGRRPTHPELLDWLAAELMDNGWRMKPLHRQIVLSATYRMSSSERDFDESSGTNPLSIDPDNEFYWRMPPRRMEAEVVRDATLYLARRLDPTIGGKELPEQQGETIPRRSLYFRTTANEQMPMLEVFDLADPNGCYRRKESVVPHQSLAMMNSGLTQDAARTIAEELAGERDFILAAFETVLSRQPTMAERRRVATFLREHPTQLAAEESKTFRAGGTAKTVPAKDPVRRAQENLIHVLFLHNDFVTIR